MSEIDRFLRNFEKSIKRVIHGDPIEEFKKMVTFEWLNEINLGFIIIILQVFLYTNADVIMSPEAATRITSLMGFYFIFIFAGVAYTDRFPFKERGREGILLFIGWFMLTLFLVSILQSMIPFPAKYSTPWLEGEHWAIFFASVLVIGVSEVYFFHGFIDRHLSKNNTKNWAGLIPVIILFCVFHLSRLLMEAERVGEPLTFYPFVSLVMIALISGILWRRTGSLIPAAAFHSAWDYWLLGGGVSIFPILG